jgi:hypothetical protein
VCSVVCVCVCVCSVVCVCVCERIFPLLNVECVYVWVGVRSM